SLEVQYQLDFRDLHDWQICGLLAFENSSSIDAHLTGCVRQARAIAHQTADRSKFSILGDHGDRMVTRQRGDLLVSTDEKRIWHQHEPFDPHLNQISKRRIDACFGTRFHAVQLHSKPARGCLKFSYDGSKKRVGGVGEYSEVRRRGHQLMQ